MTKEAQRIAIHEAVSDWRLAFEKQKWQTEDVKFLLSMCCVPNYPGDLNACFEMEKAIDPESVVWKNYPVRLWQAMAKTPEEYWGTIHATAPQRCEAFLRALNLWKE